MASGSTFKGFRRSLGQFEATTGRKIDPNVLRAMFEEEAKAKQASQARSRAIKLQEDAFELEKQYKKEGLETQAAAAKTQGQYQTAVLANLATKEVTGTSLVGYGKEGILAGGKYAAGKLGLLSAPVAETTGFGAGAFTGAELAGGALETGAGTAQLGTAGSYVAGVDIGATGTVGTVGTVGGGGGATLAVGGTGGTASGAVLGTATAGGTTGVVGGGGSLAAIGSAAMVALPVLLVAGVVAGLFGAFDGILGDE